MSARARQPRQPGVGYNFARRVHTERLRRGWSKTELHLKSGVSRSTLDNLGYGSLPPFVATVDALADTLGIPRDEAYQLAGLELPQWDPPTDASAPVRAAIEASATFTADQKAMLLAMVRTLDEANSRHTDTSHGTGHGLGPVDRRPAADGF